MARGYKYNSSEYKLWRDAVYKRDRHNCRLCGSSGKINAHHIFRKTDYPHLAHKVSNGIVLCEDCHHIITGFEYTFAELFTRIVERKLNEKFVLEFFEKISTYNKSLIRQFKKKKKWDLIPANMLKEIRKKI
jgi:ribosomal protein L37AE/L43A